MTTPQVRRVVLDEQVNQVAAVIITGRHAAAGRRQMVIHDGARCIQAAPARQLGAPAQIDVLAGEEEVVVQQANLVKHFAAIHGGAAAGAEDIFLILELTTVPLPDTAIAGAPIQRKAVASSVQTIAAVVQQQFAGNRASLWMPLKGVYDCRRPALVDFGVIVEQACQLARGSAQSGIAGAGEAAVARQLYQPHLRIVTPQKCTGVIAGSVVNDDDFERTPALPGQRIEAGRQEMRAIPVGNDD